MYSFSFQPEHRNDSPLSEAIRESVQSKRNELAEIIALEVSKGVAKSDRTSCGFLFASRCQTGLGKTFSTAAFAHDEMVETAKECGKVLEDILALSREFLQTVSSLESDEPHSQRVIKKADKLLAELGSPDLFDDHYSLAVNGLLSRVRSVKNDFEESRFIRQIEKKELLDKLFGKLTKKVSEQPESKKIVVITDTIDNTKSFYNELVDSIKKDDREGVTDFHKQFLLRRLLLLENNFTQFSKVSPETVVYLVHKVRDPDGRLDQLYINYKGIKDSIGDVAGPARRLLKETAETLYRGLMGAVNRFVKQQKAINNQYQLDWEFIRKIYELAPASRLVSNDAQVVFMTTSKYLNRITAFPRNISFSNDFQDHMLIIDEVDKQEEVIRKELIRGRAYKLVSSFKTIMQVDTVHEIENSTLLAGAHDEMSVAINNIKTVAEKWQLGKSYDFAKMYMDLNPVQLFSARGHASALVTSGVPNDTGNKDISLDWVKLTKADDEDNDRNINILSIAQRLQESDEEKLEGFPYVVNDLNHAYKDFLVSFKNACWIVVANAEKIQQERLAKKQSGIPVDEDASGSVGIVEAIDILTHQYNLRAIKDDIDDFVFSRGNKKLNFDVEPLVDNSFHSNGFHYNRITRQEASDRSVEFMTYKLPISATGALASIVLNGAEVIGISATADAETVVHNFDYKSLKKLLGKHFLELNEHHEKSVYAYYCQKRNYKGHGIKLNPQFIAVDLNEVSQHIRGTESLESHFRCIYPDRNQDAIDNLCGEISKVLSAIKLFIEGSDSRYMLSLTTRNIGKEEKEQEFLERAIKSYAESSGVTVTPFFGVNAEKMNHDDIYSDIREELSKTENKVIVFSSYKSMGAGKNPDYKLRKFSADIERLTFVDDSGYEPKEVKSDIDTIYLGRPTHMFATIDEDDDYSRTYYKMSIIYNLMVLKESGVISSLTAKRWIKSALECKNKEKDNSFLSAYMSNKNNPNSFGNGSDYIAAVRKYIEQAVGRMARTPYKRKVINIFADEELVPILYGDNRHKELMSHEYTALIEEADLAYRTGRISKTAPIILTPEEKLSINALNSNKQAHEAIKRMVNEINNRSRYTSIEEAMYLKQMAQELMCITGASYSSLNAFFQEKFKHAGDIGLPFGQKNMILCNKFLDSLEKAEKKSNISVTQVVQAAEKKLRDLAAQRELISQKIVAKWVGLREQLLLHPTVDEIPAGFEHIYIEVPESVQKQVEYRYSGIPEYGYLDSYKFFDKASGSGRVSQDKAALSLILSDSNVNAHFVNKGYATQWTPAKFMMAPVVFTNIYRPAIAEQACEAILKSIGFDWSELPSGLEEKFDGIISDKVTSHSALVDVKFWNTERLNKKGAGDKIRFAQKVTGIPSVIYLNMFKNNEATKPDYLTPESKPSDFVLAEVMDVPGIMCPETGCLIPDSIEAIRKFINR